MLFGCPKTHNAVFSLHNICGILLFTIGVTLSLNQYFRSSIHCFGDEDVPRQFSEEYCIGETFVVESSIRKEVGIDVPFPGVDKAIPGQDYKYQRKYRWVPFSIIFQSLWFYAVFVLWSLLMGNKIQEITRVNDLSIARRILHHSMGKNWFFALKYLQANVLLILNVSLQISYLDVYLDGNLSLLSMDHSEFSLAELNFPKVASCTFNKFGRSGSIEKHNLICVLHMNEVFVKMYCIDYYMLITLRILTIINFIYYCLLSVPLVPGLLYNFLVTPEYHSKTLHKLSQECFIGDWLVISLVMKEMDPQSFKDMIEMKKSKETFTGDLSFSPINQMQMCEMLSRGSVIEFLP